MDDLHRLEAKGLARAKIRSKRRRVYMIRRRTIRGSLALFAIAWAIVFGQLVTGNDPALSRTYSTRKLFASTHRGNSSPRPPGQSEEGSAAPAVVQVEPEVAEESEVPVESEVEPEPESEVEVEPEPAPEPVVTSAS
ncbi:MAG TPA: hypothetical protein VJ257_03785 [Solirubrobacterales bacterium]|nr:hypothetical protein [Solirubrobacterales bacterium]